MSLNVHYGAVVPSGPIAKTLGLFWEDGSSVVMMTMTMTMMTMMITGVGRKVEKDEGKEHLMEEAGRGRRKKKKPKFS